MYSLYLKLYNLAMTRYYWVLTVQFLVMIAIFSITFAFPTVGTVLSVLTLGVYVTPFVIMNVNNRLKDIYFSNYKWMLTSFSFKTVVSITALFYVISFGIFALTENVVLFSMLLVVFWFETLFLSSVKTDRNNNDTDENVYEDEDEDEDEILDLDSDEQVELNDNEQK